MNELFGLLHAKTGIVPVFCENNVPPMYFQLISEFVNFGEFHFYQNFQFRCFQKNYFF